MYSNHTSDQCKVNNINIFLSFITFLNYSFFIRITCSLILFINYFSLYSKINKIINFEYSIVVIIVLLVPLLSIIWLVILSCSVKLLNNRTYTLICLNFLFDIVSIIIYTIFYQYSYIYYLAYFIYFVVIILHIYFLYKTYKHSPLNKYPLYMKVKFDSSFFYLIQYKFHIFCVVLYFFVVLFSAQINFLKVQKSILSLLSKKSEIFKSINNLNNTYGGFGYIVVVLQSNEGDKERAIFEKENNVKLIPKYQYDKNNKRVQHHILNKTNDFDKLKIIGYKDYIKYYYYNDKKGVERVWVPKAKYTTKLVNNIRDVLKTHKNISNVLVKYPVEFFKKYLLYLMDFESLTLLYSKIKNLKSSMLSDIEELSDNSDKSNDEYYNSLSNSVIPFDTIKEKMDVGLNDIGTDMRIIRFGDGHYITGDGNMSFILVRGTPPHSKITQESKNLVKYVSDTVNKEISMINTVSDISFQPYFTGNYLFTILSTKIIEQDIARVSKITLLLFVGFLSIYFGNILLVSLCVLLVGIIMGITFGFVSTFLLSEINFLTFISSNVIMFLGIDYAIHYIARFAQEIKLRSSLYDSIKITIIHTAKASFISVITTLVCFILLSTSNYRGFYEFGFIGAVGILNSYLIITLGFIIFSIYGHNFNIKYTNFINELNTKLYKLNTKFILDYFFICLKSIKYIFIFISLLATILYIYCYIYNYEFIYIPNMIYYTIIIYWFYIILNIDFNIFTKAKHYSINLLNFIINKHIYTLGILIAIILYGVNTFLNYEVEYNLSSMLSKTPADFVDFYRDSYFVKGNPIIVETDSIEESKEVADHYKKLMNNNLSTTLLSNVVSIQSYVKENDQAYLDMAELIYKETKKLASFIDSLGDKYKSISNNLNYLADNLFNLYDGMYESDIPISILSMHRNLINDKYSDKYFVVLSTKITNSYANGEKVLTLTKEVLPFTNSKGKTFYPVSSLFLLASIINLSQASLVIIFYSLIFCILFIYIGFRNAISTIILTISFISNIFIMLAFMSLMSVKLNFLNIGIIPLIIGISIDGCVHIYSRFLEKDSFINSYQQSFGAVFSASFTSLVGFIALCFVNDRVIQSIGHIAILGVISDLIIALVFLPAVITLCIKYKIFDKFNMHYKL